MHFATYWSVFIVDVPYAPDPLRQHLLGLGDPLIATIVVFWNDQPPFAAA